MITALYAAALAALFLWLSIAVIRYRRHHKIGLGDSGDKGLLKRMRAQANCAEYAPLGIVLLLLVELQGAPWWLVHLTGLTLLVGRLAHGYGFSARPPIMALRVNGMLLTMASYIIAIISLVVLFFFPA